MSAKSVNQAVWTLLAVAATAAGQTAAPADKPATLEGSVVNSLNGEPLARAHVTVRGSPNGKPASYGAITTAAGKFSIAGIPRGSYSVVAEHVGFASPMGLAGTPLNTVTLHGGEASSDIRVKLTPFGSIAGRVLDANSEPVEFVRVSAETDAGPAGYGGTTDEHGDFRIGGLRPGRYRVMAAPQNIPAPPEVRSDGSAEVHYVATYSPNVIDPKEAARVAVQAGGETRAIEIRLWKMPVVRVSGTVSDLPPGASNLQIDLRRGAVSFGAPPVKPDGSFAIWRLDPGKYTATAYCQARGREMRSAAAEIEVGNANVDQVDLQIIPPADLAGQVWYEDDEAKQGRAHASPRKVLLEDLDQRISLQPVEIGADDRFHMVNVSPGRYRVLLSRGVSYVKAVRLGSTETPGNLLDLRNGASGVSVTVVLSAAMGTVSGIVTNDTGAVSGARVLLAPEDARGGIIPIVTSTTPEGAYSFDLVRPGKYKLIAVDADDTKTLEEYADRVEHIEVQPSDRLMQDLALPSQFRIGVRQ